MYTAAIVLAGGAGRRFGGDIPKQFLEVNGKTIIEYSVDAFEKNPLIDEICIVAGKDYLGLMEEIARRRQWRKVRKILPGGKERSDSSFAAVNSYRNEDMNLLIHDGARPAVSQRIINDAAGALSSFKAVCTAVPSTDTIAVSDGRGLISQIPKREIMYQVQTPQGFFSKTIAKAYDLAFEDPAFKATDDCGVVKKYLPGVEIKIIEGSRDNIKITRPLDLKIFEQTLHFIQNE